MSSIVRNSDDDPLVIAIQQPRIAIESVSPVVEEGAYPAKTESDRDLRLAARIFADGHEVLGAEVVWRRVGETAERRLPLLPEGNDFWSAQLRTPPCGRLYFRIEAWIDRFAGYRRELRAKHGARLPLDLELREGDELLQRCAERGGPEIAAACAPLAERLQACQSVEERVALWLAAQTGELLRLVGPREHLVRSREYPVEVERPLARFASWYELFPRSESGDPTRHGTFDDVIRRLPQIAAMGFDVLYFPPIHPIGRTHRKGRNNSLRAENWRWTSPSSAPPTTPGCASIPAGSPGVRTVACATRRTRRRSTRTSSTSTSTPNRPCRACGKPCATWCWAGSSRA